MRLHRRLAAVFVGLFLRFARPGAARAEEVAREDLPTQPGRKGLRFNERLRSAFRNRWLRLRRP